MGNKYLNSTTDPTVTCMCSLKLGEMERTNQRGYYICVVSIDSMEIQVK